MKNKSILFAIGLASLLAAGCSKSDRSEIKSDIKDAYHDTKDAMSDAWADVRGYSYEKRTDFTASGKAMVARVDAEVSELRANYAEAQASASRRAAMDELKNSRADFDDKLAALGTASADTWESAKANVIAAWDRLEASLRKARAEAS